MGLMAALSAGVLGRAPYLPRVAALAGNRWAGGQQVVGKGENFRPIEGQEGERDISMSDLQAALGTLTPARLQGIRRGIEKESLRATAAGSLALTPHPAALGSALTHPNITTDYSESQLELITGVHASVEQCLEELTQIHQFTY